jgi:hypothetical protein
VYWWLSRERPVRSDVRRAWWSAEEARRDKKSWLDSDGVLPKEVRRTEAKGRIEGTVEVKRSERKWRSFKAEGFITLTIFFYSGVTVLF